MEIKSISLEQKILSHIRYWKRFFLVQIRFIKTFSNYFGIIMKLLRNQYPIIIKIKNFKKFEIKSYNAAYFIANIMNFNNIQYDIDKDLVIIPNKIKKNGISIIKFYGGINNGDIIHSFLKSDYKDLPVSKKWVLDIGMNIGDSSIYFILNGATKVIGIEPFPKNFEIALKNVNENNFQDKIELVKASCASHEGEIMINLNKGGVDNIIEESETGVKIPLITLENIIKKYDIPKNSILKMDCEGCEDKIISLVTKETIRHFSHIQIEYHNGYQKIKNKLENYGFYVKISQPTSSNILGNLFFRLTNKDLSNKKIGYVGFVYAERNEII